MLRTAEQLKKEREVRKAKQRRLKRFFGLGAILVIGLIIVNLNFGSNQLQLNSIIADKTVYQDSAKMMASYIQEEYNHQLAEGTEADLNSIVKSAKNKFGKYGLIVRANKESKVLEDSPYSVWIGLDYDTRQETYEQFMLGEER